MAGSKSSNLGATSSSTSAKTMKEEKRKLLATRAEKAKKQRPFQLISYTPKPNPRSSGSGTAVPGAVSLHGGASNNRATAASPFPMTGVNGAAPLWSTAASLGVASRAATISSSSSSLPATASANNAAAPVPGQQPPVGSASSNTAAAAASAMPAARAANGVNPPLVYGQAGAGGQFVPLPLQFVSYHPPCRAGASGLLPAPAVGIPLALALEKIENAALGRMLSALMAVCHPPLLQHQSKTGIPPPWWPTGSEDWWTTELLAHLDSAAALQRTPEPVPFASSYSLKKAQRVAVLVAIVKHLSPDFARIAAAVRHSGKLSASETELWHSALNNERAKRTRPVFMLLPQPHPQGDGGSAGTDPSAAGSAVVHSGNNAAASDGCELQVQAANLPASASVAAPAGGSRGEVIAAAEVVEIEQSSDSDSDGVGCGGEVIAAAEVVDIEQSSDSDGVGGGGEVIAAAEVVEIEQSSDTDGVGGGGEVIAAAEVVEIEQSRDSDGVGGVGEVVEIEQSSDSDGAGSGVVPAADAPAGDDGRDQPANNFPAGSGDGSTHNATGHVIQVAGEPEMMMQPPPEQDSSAPGEDVAAAGDEQVHPDPPVVATNPNADAAAAAIEGAAAPEPEDRQRWFDSDELNLLFAEFESFGDDGWF